MMCYNLTMLFVRRGCRGGCQRRRGRLHQQLGLKPVQRQLVPQPELGLVSLLTRTGGSDVRKTLELTNGAASVGFH